LETIIEFSTGNGSSLVETKKLKGHLDCIIADTEARVEIVIESELGYTIFHKNDLFGVEYIPIRVRPVDNKGHGANYQMKKYLLNEKLIISVFGPKNKRIKLIFRLI